MSLLGAISQAAPHLGLGTGVLALQLRTPPLHAMAAATLQQLAGDRDVFLGVGISSPAVAGQWHGAGYTDRPIAQVREFLTLLRECLSGETVTFEGDFYDVKRFRLGVRLGERKPEDRRRRAQQADAPPRAASSPTACCSTTSRPSLVPWCVERVREGGDAEIYAYVHCAVTDRDRYADARAQGPPQLRGRRRVREPVRAGRLRRRGRALPERSGRRAIATARSRRSATTGSTRSRSWATTRTCAPRCRRTTTGVDVPIVFALPWGEDRRATVSATLHALA